LEILAGFFENPFQPQLGQPSEAFFAMASFFSDQQQLSPKLSAGAERRLNLVLAAF
jgi:hypothetical protein